MPRINSDDQILQGVAGAPASVDGRPLFAEPSGDWAWLRPGVAIGQRRFALPDQWRVELSDGTVVDDRGGCVKVVAGGGAYAYQRAGRTYTSWGRTFDQAQPIAASVDGVIAICHEFWREPYAKHVTLYRADGTVLADWPDLELGGWWDLASLRDGLFTVPDATRGWRIIDLATLEDVPYLHREDGIDVFRAFRWGSRIFTLERDGQAALSLRPIDAWDGWTVEPGPTEKTFSPDVRAIVVDDDEAHITVAWAENIQESPESLRVRRLENFASLAPLNTHNRRPPSPPPSAKISVQIARWSGALPPAWFGVCGWTMALELAVTGPGNSQWGAPTPTDRPVMEGASYRHTVRTLLLPTWQSPSPVLDIDAQIEWAKATGRKAVYLHCDSVDHEGKMLEAAARVRAAGLLPILGAHAVEDPVTFEAQARRFAALGAWGITVNAWNAYRKDTAKFAACIAKCAELAREELEALEVEVKQRPRQVVDEQRRSMPGFQCIWFWGWDRPGSFRDWPDLEAFVTEFAIATPTPERYPGEQPKAEQPTEAPIWPPRTDGGHPGSSSTSKPVKPGVMAAAVGVGLAVSLLFSKIAFWRRRK